MASNRDEFHQRPTSAAHWQGGDCGQHDWFGGRDERDGGSWLGMSRAGRFAVITNHRNPATEKPTAESRGALVRRWLEGEVLTSFSNHLEQDSAIYNGFNLLFGEVGSGTSVGSSKLWYFGNHKQPCQVRRLAAGTYGLSNASLDTPWPKVVAGRQAFENVLAKDLALMPLSHELTTLMSNPAQASDEALPQTGVPLEWERLLSSLFIVSPAYGTRATTAICVENVNAVVSVCFAERQYAASGKPAAECDEQFEINSLWS